MVSAGSVTCVPPRKSGPRRAHRVDADRVARRRWRAGWHDHLVTSPYFRVTFGIGKVKPYPALPHPGLEARPSKLTDAFFLERFLGPAEGRERENLEGVTGLYEPVHWAGAGLRVMSGGEWGPCAPGDWAMPEGAQEFQGWWMGQKIRGSGPAEKPFLLSEWCAA